MLVQPQPVTCVPWRSGPLPPWQMAAVRFTVCRGDKPAAIPGTESVTLSSLHFSMAAVCPGQQGWKTTTMETSESVRCFSQSSWKGCVERRDVLIDGKGVQMLAVCTCEQAHTLDFYNPHMLTSLWPSQGLYTLSVWRTCELPWWLQDTILVSDCLPALVHFWTMFSS